jgi:hypothetical protein
VANLQRGAVTKTASISQGRDRGWQWQRLNALVNLRQQVAAKLREVGHATNGKNAQAVEAVRLFDGCRQVHLQFKDLQDKVRYGTRGK